MNNTEIETLLETPVTRIYDVHCSGALRSESDEEFVDETQLVFPYRGTFVRHVGAEEVVAESNQVLFFNANEGYRVSHPVPGGDACLAIVIEEPLLRELAPPGLLKETIPAIFTQRRLRIDARTQVLVALLWHSLREGVAEPLEAESLALTLVRRSIGERTAHVTAGSVNLHKLVDRAKLVLASDLGRRWSLADVAAQVHCSPVYLTQIFQQVEGLPLYRYQIRLRLARALSLLSEYDDLTCSPKTEPA